MREENFNVPKLINNSGCFDLQFRKDTRRERANSPAYYRWTMQFIVTLPKNKKRILENLNKKIRCGRVHIIKNQARFSVQKVRDIYKLAIPYLSKNKNRFSQNKKKDFELWEKAAGIIYGNQRRSLRHWKKSDIYCLLEIHKLALKYKNKPRQSKWLQSAILLAPASKTALWKKSGFAKKE